ncbi:response regulator transcription factor [Aliikangiella coralliicola]|uniref:Response regulator transcription factor n=2 Tax=Aliikangiella coralliicola TaxID=2592383 RepID=A0A545UCV9_9GAMM|nr:response regulator transcription factor [Aliikangiella coralliicola]
MPAAEFLQADSVSQLERLLMDCCGADLLLMDLHMPGADGFSGLRNITQCYSQLPVIIISADENLSVMLEAQRNGALGFVSKSASISQISLAIETVLMGELSFPSELERLAQTAQVNSDASKNIVNEQVEQLTPKQFAVFSLLADGLLNKQIGYELNITEATVKAHVTAIMRKLKVNNRTQVVLIANKV